MNNTMWTFCIAVLSGCGGNASQPPVQSATALTAPPPARAAVQERGGRKLIAEIGPGGGTLELANGARLTIPEGAIGVPRQVTFAEGNHTTAFSNHEYEKTVGPILEIGPGFDLDTPLEISVPLSRLPEGFEENDLTLGLEVEARSQRAIQMQGVQTRWDYYPAGSKNGRAVATLSAVPGMRLQFLVSRGD